MLSHLFMDGVHVGVGLGPERPFAEFCLFVFTPFWSRTLEMMAVATSLLACSFCYTLELAEEGIAWR